MCYKLYTLITLFHLILSNALWNGMIFPISANTLKTVQPHPYLENERAENRTQSV